MLLAILATDNTVHAREHYTDQCVEFEDVKQTMLNIFTTQICGLSLLKLQRRNKTTRMQKSLCTFDYTIFEFG